MALAEQLCTAFAEERSNLIAGSLSDQIVPSAVWRAFQRDAAALIDWQMLWETNRSLWPKALDGRRPGFPTREHGLNGICATGWGSCSEADGGMVGYEDVRSEHQIGDNEKQILQYVKGLSLIHI